MSAFWDVNALVMSSRDATGHGRRTGCFRGCSAKTHSKTRALGGNCVWRPSGRFALGLGFERMSYGNY